MDGGGEQASEQARCARLLTLRPEPESERSIASRLCVNGATTAHGLIVSHRHSQQAYHADGDFVDVFDPESGCITEDVALADVGDFDPLPPSNSLGMIAGRIKGRSMRTRDLLREATRAFADRPMVGMDAGEASSMTRAAANWRWMTWRDVGLRAENLARALKARFPPHTFVGICALNSIEWVVAWMSVVLADLVVVPFHATATNDYARHIVQEAQLALVFVDSRSIRVLDTQLDVPLCVLDRVDVSLLSTTEASVMTIETLVQQGAALFQADVEQEAACNGLLQKIRALVVIEVGTAVDVFTADEGWVTGTVAAAQSAGSIFHVTLQNGQEIVAKRAELRVCAEHRASVLKLLQDSDCQTVLQPHADTLAAIAVQLAGTEHTAAARAAWVASIARLRPAEPSSFHAETADREDTLIGLAKLWAIEGRTDQAAVWEDLALRSGQRAWANAVLTYTREAIHLSSFAPIRAGVLDRVLRIVQRLELVDPRTAGLASDVAMRLDHTMQGDWFEAVSHVDTDTDGLVEGYVYRVLRDAELAKEGSRGSGVVAVDATACTVNTTVTVQIPAGAFVQVIQLDGKRAKVRSDYGTGWLNLFQPELAAQSNFGKADCPHERQCRRVNEDTTREAGPSILLGDPQHEGMTTLMVLYTSGSTGRPKGALITDHSFLFHVEGRERNAAPEVSDTSYVHVRCGPLSTTGDLHNLWSGLLVGGRVGLIRDSSRLFDVLESLAPDIIACVPQMWAILHKRYQQRGARCTCEEEREQLRQEARGLLGHRISMITTGGAMPQPDVMAWLRDTFPQAHVHESYGCTEAGLITKSGPGVLCEISRSCQVKLQDSPPFLTTDRPFPRGVVWVKTNTMAQGYLNRPEETRQSFDSHGFFDTGDIGELISPTQVRLIDRKKSTFKLSNGEWVAPEKVESILSGVPDVRQVYVHGSSSVSSVVAIAVSHSTPEQLSEAFLHARGKLRHFEIPKKVHVITEVWTAENGLLTGTFSAESVFFVSPLRLTAISRKARIWWRAGNHKLDRRAIREKFAAELNALLDELRRSDEAAVDAEVARAVQLVRDGEDEPGWREMSITLQANSILTQKVAFALKEFFGISVPVVALLNDLPLSNLVGYIRERQPLESLLCPIDWDDEAIIAEDLRFDHQSDIRGGEILLTGGTGHVGAAVLETLLQKQGESHQQFVCCLVRAANDEDALRRVVETLRCRGYEDAAKRVENGDGVRCQAGDLSASLLGLTEADFDQLAQSTTVILNVGCWVHHIAHYQTLKASNVPLHSMSLFICSLI